jgi:hypothetical protein
MGIGLKYLPEVVDFIHVLPNDIRGVFVVWRHS